MILTYQILTHGWNTITRSEAAWNFTSLQSSWLPSLHKTCHHFTSIITTTYPPQNPPSFHFNHHNYLPSTKHPTISLPSSQLLLPSLHKTPHHFTSVITKYLPPHKTGHHSTSIIAISILLPPPTKPATVTPDLHEMFASKTGMLRIPEPWRPVNHRDLIRMKAWTTSFLCTTHIHVSTPHQQPPAAMLVLGT